MLTTPLAPSFPPELRRAWGAEGEGEYRQLLRVTRAARGSFFLFLIESDYSPAVRDTMLDCLRDDLAAGGLRLRRVTLTADCTDLFRLPELEMPADPDEAIVLVGIENTPGLVSEPGRKPERPPIFALLNRLRETLHSRLPVPFLVWCTPSVYDGLQTHAPDFFDHYAGLFQFLDAAPAALPDRLPTAMSVDTSPLPAILSTAAMQSAVAFYEEQITRHQEPTPERAHALLGLADALVELHGPDYPQHVRRVLHVVEEALSLLSPERDAYEWARGQIIKGVVYNNLPKGDRAENLQHAIECYQAALPVFTETDFPYEWARTQNNLGNAYNDLGNAYNDLPTADRKRHPMRAIEYYYAALRVRTKTDFPYEWARTQNNLGNAYYLLPTSSRAENLQHAIECYQAALPVFTETDFPYEWARTQNNLGNAYNDLPTGEQGVNLQQAVACFEAALRVYTKADFPQEWAKTQNSLGVVYIYLPTGDRTQNFLRAVECYEAALHIFTERDLPRDWADTQYNLALAQERLGNRDAARQALHYAIAGYRQVGLGIKVEQAENTLRMLEYA